MVKPSESWQEQKADLKAAGTDPAGSSPCASAAGALSGGLGVAVSADLQGPAKRPAPDLAKYLAKN